MTEFGVFWQYLNFFFKNDEARKINVLAVLVSKLKCLRSH